VNSVYYYLMEKKILVIDDDIDILTILALLLTENGYEVKTLSCGDTVFEDIEAFRPDLILLDVMLAGMDGRAICKDIKLNQLTYFLPVILISGTHDLKQLLDLPGAPNDFLGKPFDIDMLLERIEKQLAA
jgi:DNA-binding response OmpR family regulator